MLPLASLNAEASTDLAPLVAPVLPVPGELPPPSSPPQAASTSEQAKASNATKLGRTLMSLLFLQSEVTAGARPYMEQSMCQAAAYPCTNGVTPRGSHLEVRSVGYAICW